MQQMNSNKRTGRIGAAATALVAALTLLGGCASTGGNGGVKPSRTVSLGEFAEPTGNTAARPTMKELDALEARTGGDAPAAGDQRQPDSDVTIVENDAAPGRLGAGGPEAAAEMIDKRAEQEREGAGGGAAQSPAGRSGADAGTSGAITRVTPGEEVIVDSLIGQVNGRPIFADEFFEPIEAQLQAASQRMNTQEFAQQAVQIVSTRLLEVVQNELVLAEAEAGLTQEERKGIFAFMRYLQEDVIAKEGSGTRGETERRLREEEGVSLEEYLELEKNKALISKLIFEKIRPRVIVSWRDIEREYERRKDEYQPPALVTLSRIRLDTREQTRQIEQVRERLEAGEDFAAVAESLGFENGGEWMKVEMGPGGVEDMQLNPEIISNLEDVDIGHTSNSFPVGSSTWWLHVANVEQPPQRSIYDPQVQRELTRYLYNVRFREQHDRYIQSLLDRGIFDELDEMRSRLVTIAMVRYAP